MVKFKIATGLLLSSLLLTACNSGDQASTSTGGASSTNELDNTKEESTVGGTLSFYTSQPDEDAQKLIEAFESKYPDVTVELFRSGTEEVITKVKAEQQAGEVQADVLLVADAVTFESLKQDKLLYEYISDETAGIPEQFVDEDGMYTGTKVMATAMVVNTTKVKELPDSWSVLTDSQTKATSIMPSPLYSGAAAYNLGVFTRNNAFEWDFYRGLKDNEVTVSQGNGAVLKAVASGEKSYGMVVDYLVARAKAEGSPVELVYPTEGVPVITEPIGIMKGTDNEEAAKAFVDFVLSEDGQRLAAELGYAPIRKGIEAPEGLKGIEDLTVLDVDIKELYKDRESDKQQFSELFGAQ